MRSPRIFAVTGSNKGIGKSIVRLLLQDNQEKIVYLTSRNVERGQQAVKELEAEGLNPKLHQLDITNEKSLKRFRNHLVEKHDGLDVLVNNAGIGISDMIPHIGLDTYAEVFAKYSEIIINMNFFSTLSTCNILFPILKDDGRVVNVSSLWCEIIYLECADEIRKKIRDECMTMEGLKMVLSEFIDASKDLTKEGQAKLKYLYGQGNRYGGGMPWAARCYGMSKLALAYMTILQQMEFSKFPNRNISVNSCCPGFVITDQTRTLGLTPEKAISADEAADTPVYLALLPTDSKIKGSYVKLRKIFPYPPCK